MVPKWASAHHEMLDGSGYPKHLKGDEICFESRILAVVDIVMMPLLQRTGLISSLCLSQMPLVILTRWSMQDHGKAGCHYCHLSEGSC